MRRTGWGIAFCMLGASAVTWLRLWAAGTPRIDQIALGPWAEPALFTAFGVVMALAARLYLRHEPMGSVRRLLWPALVIQGFAALALPFTSNDVFTNLATGRMMLRGINPYLAGPSALPAGDAFLGMVGLRWLDAATPYGPLVAWGDALAARFGGVTAALLVFKLLLLACSALVVLAVYAICRRRLGERAAPAFALVAMNPLLAWEVAAQAHNDGFMVLALAAFIWAALEERETLAVLCLVAATFTKLAGAPVLALYLVYLARRSPWKAAAMAGLTLAAGAILCSPFWAGADTLHGPMTAAMGDPARTARSLADFIGWLADEIGRGDRPIIARIATQRTQP